MSGTPHARMNGPVKGLLLVWMATVALVFMALAMPPDLPLPHAMSQPLLWLRAALWGWFFGPSAY